MAAVVSMPRTIDPKLTENYFLNLIGVVDASVWWHNEQLHAHLVMVDDSPFTPRSLQATCAEDLGLHQTPHQLTVSFKQRTLRVA